MSTWVFLKEMLRRWQGLDLRDGGSARHWTGVDLTGRSALDVLLRTYLFLYVHKSAGVIEGVGPVTGGEPAPALKRTGKFSCPLDEEVEKDNNRKTITDLKQALASHQRYAHPTDEEVAARTCPYCGFLERGKEKTSSSLTQSTTEN